MYLVLRLDKLNPHPRIFRLEISILSKSKWRISFIITDNRDVNAGLSMGEMSESFHSEIIVNHNDAFLRPLIDFLKSLICFEGFTIQNEYFLGFDAGVKHLHKIGQVRTGEHIIFYILHLVG